MITDAASLLECASPDAILGACRWFDDQRYAGPGLLVDKIRAGGMPGYRSARRSLIDEQRLYAEEIVGWLRKHFPDLDRPVHGPHPAAVAEVIRLHGRFGKGRWTVSEHGPAIRAAVKAWEAKWGEGGNAGLPS